MKMKKRLAPAALLITGILALAGCSADDSTAPNTPGSTESSSATESAPANNDVYVLSDDIDVEISEDTGAVFVTNVDSDNPPSVDELHQVHIYQDVQCPHCQGFEASIADDVKRLLESEVPVSFNYTTMFYLGTEWSLSSANALNAVADNDDIDQYYLAAQEALFESLPMEPLTKEQADDLVVESLTGVIPADEMEELEESIRSGEYSEAINTYTDRSLNEDGITGTPTVIVDGEKYNDYNKGAEKLAGIGL